MASLSTGTPAGQSLEKSVSARAVEILRRSTNRNMGPSFPPLRLAVRTLAGPCTQVRSRVSAMASSTVALIIESEASSLPSEESAPAGQPVAAAGHDRTPRARRPRAIAPPEGSGQGWYVTSSADSVLHRMRAALPQSNPVLAESTPRRPSFLDDIRRVLIEDPRCRIRGPGVISARARMGASASEGRAPPR